MVVAEQAADLAIVTDGSGGYLVVEILGRASTYKEAQAILADEQELEEDEEDLEDDEDGEEEDDEEDE